MAARRVVLLLAVLVVCSAGCSLAGRTFGGYVDDKLVKGAVKWRLANEAGTLRTGVNVDTFGGTVYLSGSVDTPQQKLDAEMAAWQVGGVAQVVNDLVVRREDAPAASPSSAALHPLRQRLPGVARVVTTTPGGPELAYDAHGQLLATVHTVSSRELLDRDVERLGADGRPIRYVELFPLVGRSEVPGPRYAVILWHVSESEAAALR
jgi:hyperosmotically inducible periplasmic protein